jgi:hypothetical protein
MKETAVNETGLTVIEDVPSEVATADLLGSSPRERIAQASAVAEILAPVIREQRLYAMIGRKEYVTFEGWTLLGSLLGVFPVTESVAEIERLPRWLEGSPHAPRLRHEDRRVPGHAKRRGGADPRHHW